MSTLERSQRTLGMGIERPADARVMMVAAVAAVLTDLAVRSGVAGLAGTLLVVAVAVGVLATGRVASPQAAGVVAAAIPFGICLAIRTSPWLLPLDILAVAGLLVLGASLASGGSVLDLPLPTVAMRAVHAVWHGLAAPAFLVAPFERRRSIALVRGVALALPLLVVLGLLLASADVVFAGFFRGWSPASAIGHAVLMGLGAWGMAGLLRLSSAEPAPAPPRLSYRLGHVEATVVLGSLVTLFAAFAAAQVIAAAGGGEHVLRTAGLTYAEYARSGFFQLLAVAAITLIALVALRGATDLSDDRHRRRFTVLAEASVALTLVIVAVALRRLALYQHAYGLTMLRLYSTVFAVWIGVVILLAGAALARRPEQPGAGEGGARQAWFPAAAAATGLLLLLSLNVANPEAVVVRHNVDRAARTQKVDPSYLAQLSDDAVPALVRALPQLGEPVRSEVLTSVCSRGDDPYTGWAATNTSRRRAMDARRQVCRPDAIRR